MRPASRRSLPNANLAVLFPWAFRKLVVEGSATETRHLADLPPEAAVDRASWEALATKSSLMVPIVTASAVSHLIVMASVTEEREWPVEYVPRLRVLGEMMAAAVQRQQAFDALRASEAHLREGTARLAAAVEAAELGFSEWIADDGSLFLDAHLQTLLGIGPEDAAASARRSGCPAWLPSTATNSRSCPAIWSLAGSTARPLSIATITRAGAGSGYGTPPGALRADQATGRGEKVITAVQDITDRRAREEALQQAHDEVKRLRDRLERENVYLRKEVAHGAGSDLVIGHSPAIMHALELATQVAPTDVHGAPHRGDGDGQGAFCLVHPRGQPAPGPPHGAGELLGDSERPHRERAVRPRERCVHRRRCRDRSAASSWPTGRRCSSTRSATCRSTCRSSCCACCRSAPSSGSAARRPIAVDVRIIAATNRDLEAAVRAGKFRSDLYYRLNVFPIVVPPLRERREDIPVLVETLVDELGALMRKRIDSVDRASIEALTRYHWPGNVRELRNVLERAMILASGPSLSVAPPPSPATAPAVATASPVSLDMRDVEREHVLRVLEAANWKVRGANGAAEVLGLKPTTLEARIAKLGIRRPNRRA